MTVRDAPRPPAQRKVDALAQLQTPGIDVWVATAGTSDDDAPVPHLVPLSLAWIDEHVVIALDSQSTTARNLATDRPARLAVGATRDVVLIDAVVAEVVGVGETAELADQYCAQADWDPRSAGDGYVFIRLRPERLQAWREVNELDGRTLMRRGAWTV